MKGVKLLLVSALLVHQVYSAKLPLYNDAKREANYITENEVYDARRSNNEDVENGDFNADLFRRFVELQQDRELKAMKGLDKREEEEVESLDTKEWDFDVRKREEDELTEGEDVDLQERAEEESLDTREYDADVRKREYASPGLRAKRGWNTYTPPRLPGGRYGPPKVNLPKFKFNNNNLGGGWSHTWTGAQWNKGPTTVKINPFARPPNPKFSWERKFK